MRAPEQALWQAVLYQAVYDATSTFDGGSEEDIRARREAKSWISSAGKDFQTVCTLAGFDPGFIHSAFCRGRFDFDRLRKASAYGRSRA